jgi:hypothetical protein
MREIGYISAVKSALNSVGMNGEIIAGKLIEYEGLKILEKKGKLIKLPCSEGDMIYVLEPKQQIYMLIAIKIIHIGKGLK